VARTRFVTAAGSPVVAFAAICTQGIWPQGMRSGGRPV
jgi:hypothetical protein